MFFHRACTTTCSAKQIAPIIIISWVASGRNCILEMVAPKTEVCLAINFPPCLSQSRRVFGRLFRHQNMSSLFWTHFFFAVALVDVRQIGTAHARFSFFFCKLVQRVTWRSVGGSGRKHKQIWFWENGASLREIFSLFLTLWKKFDSFNFEQVKYVWISKFSIIISNIILIFLRKGSHVHVTKWRFNEHFHKSEDRHFFVSFLFYKKKKNNKKYEPSC